MSQQSPFEVLSAIGEKAGLDKADLDLAFKRISFFLASMMTDFNGSSSMQKSRMMEGVSKNLADNPMLVAWALKVASSSSEEVWQKFADNFLLSMVYERKQVVEALKEELGYHPPITLVLNPTMRCSLRCKGCYAHEFDRRSDMDRKLLDKVLTEASDLGISFITITGGEAFLYPDIEDVFASYPDITFMVYTNGQHINEERAIRLSKLGNVWPAISVEGYEEETDLRRGDGVFQKLTLAMDYLKKHGVLFGISAVPTRENTDLLASDEFIDHYIEKGALLGWMFTYMPVGLNPDVNLMATPAQREKIRQASLRWRQTKPFFMADFWSDGPLCGGCMSANRYAFITNDGWVQPCVFVHFATHNIKEHTLREVFDSQFFSAIRARQPYGTNLLRPCKIIDHPHVLRQLVAGTNAMPTYPGAETIISDPRITKHLDNYSREYASIADKVWEDEYASGHNVQVPFFGKVDLHKIYAERMRNASKQEKEMVPSELKIAFHKRKSSS
jgi:MoaA/NifB/PqqE/SkfB family radical SAM enzyme